jgi:uncharacterized protein YoxC
MPKSSATLQEDLVKFYLNIPSVKAKRQRIGQGKEPEGGRSPVIPALIVAAALVYVGYRIGKPADSVAESVKRVADAVADVKKRVDVLLDKVDELISSIEKLEKELKGYIDRDRVRAALTNVRSSSQILNSYLTSEKDFRKNLQSASRACDQLIYDINIVKEYTGGGLSAIMQIAPGMVLWAQTFTLIQRVQRERDARPLTVWDHHFHKDNADLFRQFFQTADSFHSTYEKELPLFPVPRAVYRNKGPYAGHSFEKIGMRYDWGYTREEGKPNVFSITENTYELSSLVFDNLQQPEIPPLNMWIWKHADDPYAPQFSDQRAVTEAYNLWQPERNRKLLIEWFYQYLRDKDYDYARTQISDSFIKPPDWGGTTEGSEQLSPISTRKKPR